MSVIVHRCSQEGSLHFYYNKVHVFPFSEYSGSSRPPPERKSCFPLHRSSCSGLSFTLFHKNIQNANIYIKIQQFLLRLPAHVNRSCVRRPKWINEWWVRLSIVHNSVVPKWFSLFITDCLLFVLTRDLSASAQLSSDICSLSGLD